MKARWYLGYTPPSRVGPPGERGLAASCRWPPPAFLLLHDRGFRTGKKEKVVSPTSDPLVSAPRGRN